VVAVAVAAVAVVVAVSGPRPWTRTTDTERSEAVPELREGQKEKDQAKTWDLLRYAGGATRHSL
jgi:hypothetical protein